VSIFIYLREMKKNPKNIKRGLIAHANLNYDRRVTVIKKERSSRVYISEIETNSTMAGLETKP